MATAESLAHELRSRGWNTIASLLNVTVEGREISGTWVCEIDDDNQHQPVDVNVYHYGPNGHVWQAGTTTHEARASLPKTPLGVRRIAGAETHCRDGGMATTQTRLGDSLKPNNAGVVFARNPALGPTVALLIAIAFFSIATNTFFNIDNFSAVVNQTTVIGALALGQTPIILTAGIDLANAAIAVFGTILITQLVSGGLPSPIGLAVGIVACGAIAMVSGLLVTQLRLPPFIVTLGMLAVMTAVTNLYSGGTTHPVPEGVLTWLGTQTYLFGGIPMTYGMGVTAILFAITWAALAKTAWGRHVYAIGDDPESARFTGINVRVNLVSVYIVAGIIYGFAAWIAMGRTPTADPNAYQTGNLDSITAVVIGGTSLFGGRGGVAGTIIGALIVAVLRSGLTQMGIDSNYQNLATGVLVIAAVAFDQLTRRRMS